MTLKNNRAPLLCYFKLCAWFHCHMRIQTGVRVRKRLIPQSHRPNRHETDLKPTKILKFGERSVYSRYWFGFVGLVSVYVRADKFVGERSFKHVWKISPRQIVGCLSVICRCDVGFVGERSVLIRPPMVDGLSVLDRLCIRHMSADLTPIQGRFKTESSPT